MGQGKRLKQFHDHLKSIGYGGRNKFEAALGKSSGYLTNAEKHDSVLRSDIIEVLKLKFPELNIDWLLTGSGNMLNESTPRNEAVIMSQSLIKFVPLVNQYAQAGYLSGYQDNEYMKTLPTIPVIVDKEADGNYIAFEVRGDSMNNGTEESYLQGDRILCKEIPPYLWAECKLHIKRWDFVIVHEDGVLIKRIINHDVPNHTITIHSLNEMYQDRTIDLMGVKQIFQVVERHRNMGR